MNYSEPKNNKLYNAIISLAFIFIGLFAVVAVQAGTTGYQYDALHRLKQVTLSDGTTTIYTYDDLGNRTSMVITTPGTIDYYCDNDTDGYYDSSVDGTCSAGPNCPPANCQTTQGNDCNDLDDTIYPTATELCDNKDNDCNSGTTDGSGESWYGDATSCGLGVCSSTGQLDCSDGNQVDTCTVGSPAGDDTDCDDLDDDCDGLVDEHYVTTTTNCGTGVCSSTGLLECQSGSEVDACTPGTPTETPEETCNDTLDNDCDSFADFADGDCLSSQIIIQSDPTEGMDVWITSVYDYNDDYGVDDSQLKVGGWGDYYYSLIKFYLNGLPINITTAEIYLYNWSNNNATSVSMYLDRVTGAWDEDTGWYTRPASEYMSTLPIPTIDSWYVIDITALYNAWQDGTYVNHGIQLRPTSVNNNFNIFYSSDYMDDISLRPKLVIEVAAADYYCDYDGDGYISTISYGTCSDNGCVPVGCQIVAGEDCDDGDEYAFPEAIEICDDGIDQDCDGSDLICSIDSDNDGIYDDGDESGVVGDYPCTGGNTQSCDDNCIYTPNPNQVDMDSDGVGDVCDNCECVENLLQIDTDDDGYGNKCDADLNNDGSVDGGDWGMFAYSWDACEGDDNYIPEANLTIENGDTCVDGADLSIFAYYWDKPVAYCE